MAIYTRVALSAAIGLPPVSDPHDEDCQLAGEDLVHDAVVSDACPAQASQVAF